MRFAVKETIVCGFILGGALGIIHCGASDAVKEAAAESAYLAEHMRCVDKYETKTEIDACRAAVRVRWGIAEVSAKNRDAGGD